MSSNAFLLLALGMMLTVNDSPRPAVDMAQLREMLQDRQHPQNQSQAALLLVQARTGETEAVVRQGLRHTESPDAFIALAAAVRIERAARYAEELLAALRSGKAGVRQAAAEALSTLADNALVLRLQSIASDPQCDMEVRRAALWTLGRSGRKSAAVVLLDQLSGDSEALRKSAVEALAELTGCAFGGDLDKWRTWWQRHKDLSAERWAEERLAYQSLRTHRLEGDLDRARAQIVRLQQQLYARLPVADRLSHLEAVAEQEDPGLRALVVGWAVELLPAADPPAHKALADVLLRLSGDANVEVQRPAVLALGRVNDPRAFERLHALLGQGPSPVRAVAARALAQQARAPGTDTGARQRQAVALLQKALEDPALEVVVEAAEDLGSLGVPEAGPILAALLRHPSEPVRLTAAQALERVADVALLDGLLDALTDTAVPVRFSLVGALGHAVGDGRAVPEAAKTRLLSRLQELLQRDADPGVRSRAATVLGECGAPVVLAVLWQRVTAGEDSRVQEKAWSAVIDVVLRTGNLELLREWEQKLADAKQGARRLQLLTEAHARWQKRDDARPALVPVMDLLVQAQLEQGKWSAALPVFHELLAQPASDADRDRRLQGLLAAGDQALKEGNRAQALLAVQEAQPHLPRTGPLADDFARLEQLARPK